MALVFQIQLNMSKLTELPGLDIEDIVKARVCPYCGSVPERVSSSVVYSGVDYGMIRHCAPCKAWVGEHKQGDLKGEPLGRLADPLLRLFKKDAHHYFDMLWSRKMVTAQIPKNEARGAAYKWLSEQMKITPDKCHIGMFNVQQCIQVIDLCKPIINKWK